MNYHIILASIAIIIAIIGTLPYIYYVLKKNTKPHIFSWFLWSLLGWTAFFAQFVSGAGAGAWVTASMATLCAIVFVSALLRGKVDYLVPIDWVCFCGAILGIVLWITTKNPLTAIILVTITDAVAFFPTFRKAYRKPHEESLTVYLGGFAQQLLGIFALSSFNLTTALYPASLVFTNLFFITFVLIRRTK